MNAIGFVEKNNPHDRAITMTLKEIVYESYETQLELRESGLYPKANWSNVEKKSGVYWFINLTLKYLGQTTILKEEKEALASGLQRKMSMTSDAMKKNNKLEKKNSMAKRPDVNDIIDPNNKPMDTEQNNILETKNQGKESDSDGNMTPARKLS